MKYYNHRRKCLLVFHAKATPSFWDEHWKKREEKNAQPKPTHLNIVTHITKKYLPPGSKILEGGCGAGQYVLSLKLHGYAVYGVDTARETICSLLQKSETRDASLQIADVRTLPFEDNSFDGYWSLGVIEHFYEGYESLIREAHRVIKKDGFFFLSFPYMSPLRRWKASRSRYQQKQNFDEQDINTFYQFILDAQETKNNVEQQGFIYLTEMPWDATSGITDEIPAMKYLMKPIVQKNALPARLVRILITVLFARLVAHSIVLIFQKR